MEPINIRNDQIAIEPDRVIIRNPEFANAVKTDPVEAARVLSTHSPELSPDQLVIDEDGVVSVEDLVLRRSLDDMLRNLVSGDNGNGICGFKC